MLFSGVDFGSFFYPFLSAQERAKSGQERAKSGQERPKSGQERPKSDQERLKSGQERPRATQERLKSGQERPKSGQESHFPLFFVGFTTIFADPGVSWGALGCLGLLLVALGPL